MEAIEKMGRYYTAMLKTICGDDYDKIQAASDKASQHRSDCAFRSRPKIQIGKNVLKRP